MYGHFNNIKKLYGRAYVQMPNGIFRDLSNIDNNIQHTSFSYAYLVTIAFLYKYANFVDTDNGTYMQNSDIKQLLGYNRNTKTVDKLIKKNGILERVGLISTIKDYPVHVNYIDEIINGAKVRSFATISMVGKNDFMYNVIKRIVKNRNYEVKEPKFLFEYKEDIGTLYNYDNTHRVTIDEFLKFIMDDNLDNTDFLLYSYFKYRCYGLKDNMFSISLQRIISDTGIGNDSFYVHLNKLKDYGFLDVAHKLWNVKMDNMDANEYYFNGIL